METRSGNSSPTLPGTHIIKIQDSVHNTNQQNDTSTGSESPSINLVQNVNHNDTSTGSPESSSVSVQNMNQDSISTGSPESSSISAQNTSIGPGESSSISVQNTSTGSAESSPISVQNINQNDASNGSQSSSLSTQNVIPNDTPSEPTRPPSLHLLSEKKNNHKLCLDLRKAALKGKVDEALTLIRGDHGSKLLRAAITEGHETVLHVAAGAKQARFVEDMINYLMQQDDLSTLKLQNRKGNTAFCFAAMAGSMEIIKAMLDKDLDLLKIRGGENMTPLYLACLFGQKASFLYVKIKDTTEEILSAGDKRAIFLVSIKTTLYDLALKLLEDDHEAELALAYHEHDGTPLHMLARTPLHLLAQTSRARSNESVERDLSTQALELVERLWDKILEEIYKRVEEYFNENSELLFDAAHLGNLKFLAKLIDLYPDLVHILDDKNRSIFHIAIMHRHTNLFNLIYEIGFDKQLIATYLDEDKNSILHLAAKYPDPRPVSMVPGAALEMQEELKTFKEVELLVMPSYREMKNSEGKTPRQLFTIEHVDLLKQREDWMRKTANSCKLVATLIATVVFAAAFSVPGGNKDDDGVIAGNKEQEGIPIHLGNILFRIFAIAESIALSSSSISILMFLSILTSRYTENDFLTSLPRKLVAGLLTLFISIATIMMLAFIPSIFLAYSKHRSNVIPILSTILVYVPVFVFIYLQYDLFKDILYSSVRFRLPTKPRKY